MKFDISRMRHAADVGRFPYRDQSSTLLHISSEGVARSEHTVSGKREILDAHKDGDLLLASWTGHRITDMFVVDADAARAAVASD